MTLRLKPLLKQVRRKLQAERIARGVAMLLFYSLIFTLLSSYFLANYNFSDSALFWSRLAGGFGFLLILFLWILRPLLQTPTDRQVARFLEENSQQLEDRLSTAVHVTATPGTVHPQIQELIEKDAARQVSRLKQPGLYHPRATLTSLTTIFVSLLVATILFLGGPQAYRYSLTKLLGDWLDKNPVPLYSIQVEPGNTTVPERADLEIQAALQGFQSNRVLLFAQYENQPHWEQVQMQPNLEGGNYSYFFFDIRDPVRYYAEADGIRSDTFLIQVSEVPRVQSLRIDLEFPEYTHLKPVTLEDEGDIRALIGTHAKLEIETDQPVLRALLRFENAGEIALQQTAPTKWKTSFEVKTDDFYRIHLANQEDVLSPGSSEYFIEALEDQPPSVSITQPGRDRKVTNIEEVYAEVNSEDDHGLLGLALEVSINGGPEQSIPLPFRRGTTETTASHTFFLEEFDLQPGDFLSYYARATDAVTHSSTDIYFLEVEPFDKEFYQSQANQGGGFGGENFDFVKQQKQIIVATFKLTQQRRQFSEKEFDENSQTLALLQQELQNQTQTIIDRIQRRQAAISDTRFQKMAEYLTVATGHMQTAYQALNQLDPEKALPEEQKALQQLMRAEALFKEIQVSFGQNSGNSGASAEDLADLVDLELDRTKNQYETLQQNQAQKREEALDEALEKLKELAHRQEQQLERKRRAQQSSGSGSSQSSDQMIEELEKLARELARLSRQQQDPQLSQISSQLKRAARDLKQARASGQNSQESLRADQEALQRLQEAGRRLSQQRQQQIREDLEQLKRDAEALVRDQQEVMSGLGDLEKRLENGDMDQETSLRYGQLLRKKGEMQEDLQELESALHQAARQTESQEPSASRKLKEAGINIRDQRIPEKMQEGTQLMSRGWMNLARQREDTVKQELEALAEKIGEAEQALGAGGEENTEEKLQRALDETTRLTDKLEALRQRAQNQPGQGEEPAPDRQSENNGSPQQGLGKPGDEGQSDQQGQGDRRQQGSGEGEVESAFSRRAGARASSGIEPRQFRREWQQRLNEARRLSELLQEDRQLAGSLQELLRQMRRLDADRILLDPEELAALDAQVIQGFHQLELEISQTLQEQKQWIRLANEDEIPAEFREKVEEYYRLLSERRKEGKPPGR